MLKEERIVYYDKDLKIEAYQFKGIMQKFPNHFHQYYVIGFIEKGCRHLSCRNQEYSIHEGDMVIFNPNENHTCEQIDQKTLDYRCLNIKEDVMERIMFDITGDSRLPQFKLNIVQDNELVSLLQELHQMIMEERSEFEKEEIFLLLMEQLIQKYSEPISIAFAPDEDEINKVVSYMERHYEECISLSKLSEISGLNKYVLVRTFTKKRGITPYQYLVTIRINKAKEMLENGDLPLQAAMQTGFTDQSHFTKFFKKLIGLTPGQYKDIFKEMNRDK